MPSLIRRHSLHVVDVVRKVIKRILKVIKIEIVLVPLALVEHSVYISPLLVILILIRPPRQLIILRVIILRVVRRRPSPGELHGKIRHSCMAHTYHARAS